MVASVTGGLKDLVGPSEFGVLLAQPHEFLVLGRALRDRPIRLHCQGDSPAPGPLEGTYRSAAIAIILLVSQDHD